MKKIKAVFGSIKYSINLIYSNLFVVFFSNSNRENSILNKSRLLFNSCFNSKTIL